MHKSHFALKLKFCSFQGQSAVKNPRINLFNATHNCDAMILNLCLFLKLVYVAFIPVTWAETKFKAKIEKSMEK